MDTEKIFPEVTRKIKEREEIRAATVIFDVIKTHCPQPVDDITDYNLGFLQGETASKAHI